MRDEAEQALFDARWLLNEVGNADRREKKGIPREESDEAEHFDRFIASYERLLTLA